MIKKYNNFINESNDNNLTDISILLGRTLTDVIKKSNDHGDSIIFVVDDGSEYKMYHEQDCCESVKIEDINGDLDDLIGSPILQARTVTNREGNYRKSDEDESFLWTFYKLATIKGYVVIRWYGTSNGYYSEEVNFEKIK